MGRDTLTLVLLYTNLTTRKVPVKDVKAAREFVALEGDHVFDWYVEKR